MDNKVNDIFCSFGLTEDEKKAYTTLLELAGSQPLQVKGKFEVNLWYKIRSSKQTVYVVSTLSKPLLWKASE